MEPLGGRDLAHATARRDARQPGEEPAQRRAVADVGGAGTIELGLVLACLERRAGIAVAHDHGASGLQPIGEPRRRGRGIDLDPASRRAERVEGRAEIVRRTDRDTVVERTRQSRRQLAPVDEQLDVAIVGDYRVAQRHRRIRYVAAPHVEQPSHRIRSA